MAVDGLDQRIAIIIKAMDDAKKDMAETIAAYGIGSTSEKIIADKISGGLKILEKEGLFIGHYSAENVVYDLLDIIMNAGLSIVRHRLVAKIKFKARVLGRIVDSISND